MTNIITRNPFITGTTLFALGGVCTVLALPYMYSPAAEGFKQIGTKTADFFKEIFAGIPSELTKDDKIIAGFAFGLLTLALLTALVGVTKYACKDKEPKGYKRLNVGDKDNNLDFDSHPNSAVNSPNNSKHNSKRDAKEVMVGSI